MALATTMLLDIALALYYCLVVYRLIKLITSKHRSSSQWLDLCSHFAMVLFLSLTFQVIKSDQMDVKINLSTALAVLCSCLVSLVFGINIGRSWGPENLPAGNVVPSVKNIPSTTAVTPSGHEQRRRKGKANEEDVFSSVDAALFHEAKRQNDMLQDNHQLVSALELAKHSLNEFWELKASPEAPLSLTNTQPKWKLARTEHNSHVWVSKEKSDGVMIRGTAVLSSISPAAALRYILDHDCSTALEGITSKHEIVHSSPKDRLIVRKLYCNLGTLTSSKREFIVATTWAELETQPGNFLIVSVSVPQDSYATRKGYIRAVLHTSGYILSKRAVLDGGGCQIQFGVHMDLGGGSSRRLNAAKSDAIATAVLSHIYSMQNLSAPEIARLEVQRNLRRMSSQQPALQLAEISDQQRIELFSVSQDAIRRLRQLYASVMDPIPPAAGERSWVNFFDQNGVTISEYSGGTGQPIGTLQACCHVDASWDAVQNLLIDHPEKVDALLEGSTVLCDLDANTFVQWIAYGAIWPVGARDFLVVTQVDQLSERGGFLIVSTSVDSVCEDLELGHYDETDSASNDEDDSKYTRSTLKLAGYVGVPNLIKGGTDLHLFVDVDVASFVPSWLLQMLAQYGLSEIMTRIRAVASQDTPARINSTDGVSAPIASPQRVPSTDQPSCMSPEDRNRQLCQTVAEESRSYLEIYLGRKKDPAGVLKFDWQSRAKKSGIEVFGSAVPGSAWNAIRATATMRAHRKNILALLIDDSKIGYYDDMFDSCEMIMRLNECTSVRRIRFKAIWPTAPRDFVVLTTWTELPDGSILISSRSAPNSLYPKEAEVVRGNIQVSGYLIRPIDGSDGKTCEVTLCAHSDLGGTLPIGIINMLSSAAPLKILSTISQLVGEA